MKQKKNFLEIGTRMLPKAKDPEPIGKVIEPAVNLSKEQFIKKYPDIFAEWVKDGEKEGQMLERGRIGKLIEMKKRPEFSDIPQVIAVIDKAIIAGTAIDEIQPLIMDALLKVKNDPCRARMAVLESPPDIGVGDGEYFTSNASIPSRIADSGIGQPEIPGAPPRGRAKEKMISEV